MIRANSSLRLPTGCNHLPVNTDAKEAGGPHGPEKETKI